MNPGCQPNEIATTRGRLSRSWSHFAIRETGDKRDESSSSLQCQNHEDTAVALETPQTTKLKFAMVYDEAIPSPPMMPIRQRSNQFMLDRPPSPPTRRSSVESVDDSPTFDSDNKLPPPRFMFNGIPTSPLIKEVGKKGGILRNKKRGNRKSIMKHQPLLECSNNRRDVEESITANNLEVPDFALTGRSSKPSIGQPSNITVLTALKEGVRVQQVKL